MMSLNPILAAVRRVVGRRHEISRQEMAAILAALGSEGLIDMDNGWGGARTAYLAMDRRRMAIVAERDAAERAIRRRDPLAEELDSLPPPSVRDSDLAAMRPTVEELAQGWAECARHRIVSVLADTDPRLGSNPGDIRYDDGLGPMHPLMRATIMFASARYRDSEYDQVGQMRERARRVLLVRD